MNVLLLVVDSLRASSLFGNGDGTLPRTPFLERLAMSSVNFTRAYAPECWTLPAHCSMFTGLLPSEHGAHFQTMGYTGTRRTAAEILSGAGYHTELVTRNPLFDGNIPGLTRGFAARADVMSPRGGTNAFSLLLAMTKPRFYRQIRETGFCHPLQRKSREFVTNLARSMLPADRVALEYLLRAMQRCRDERTPYFMFCNLYDVHVPYSPSEESIFRPFRNPGTWLESALMPFLFPKLGRHAYLRENFSMPAIAQRVLLGRYHSAIELMDEKLAAFHAAASERGLLDDTLVILTSDHGEAFGEHELYLHDASVHEENLHVPLMVCHPDRQPETVHDVVSTRDLFDLLCSAARRGDTRGTILDPTFRAANPVALAEHFYYPNIPDARPRYRQNLVAAIAGDHKIIVRGEGVELYDLARDRGEHAPETGTIGDFAALCRTARLPESASGLAVQHLQAFQARRNRSIGLAA